MFRFLKFIIFYVVIYGVANKIFEKIMEKDMNSGAGKGDKLRPVDQKKYNKNYDEIDWSAHKKKKISEEDWKRMEYAANMSKI